VIVCIIQSKLLSGGYSPSLNDEDLPKNISEMNLFPSNLSLYSYTKFNCSFFVLFSLPKMYCPDGKYSASAALWLQVPEATVRSLFHDAPGTIKISNSILWSTWVEDDLENFCSILPGSFDTSTVVCFAIVYYILSVWTYGLSVSGGIFIPNLVIGAAWGRLVGILLQSTFPDTVKTTQIQSCTHYSHLRSWYNQYSVFRSGKI